MPSAGRSWGESLGLARAVCLLPSSAAWWVRCHPGWEGCTGFVQARKLTRRKCWKLGCGLGGLEEPLSLWLSCPLQPRSLWPGSGLHVGQSWLFL